MPPVVADSTCLISPERTGRLELLPAVFPDILAPPAVQQEVGRSFAWLRVRDVSNTLLLASLRRQVDHGE